MNFELSAALDARDAASCKYIENIARRQAAGRQIQIFMTLFAAFDTSLSIFRRERARSRQTPVVSQAHAPRLYGPDLARYPGRPVVDPERQNRSKSPAGFEHGSNPNP